MSSFVETDWKKLGSGSWTGVANWSNGLPSGPTSLVVLGTQSAAYTVSLASAANIGNLNVGSGATLSLTSATLSITDGVSLFSNIELGGTVKVGAGGTLSFGLSTDASNYSAEIVGPGLLNITSSAAAATLSIADSWFGLVGGGRITMAGSAAQIVGSTSRSTDFENTDGAINGAGLIGNGANAAGGNGLWLNNDSRGTINASSALALTLNTGTNQIENAGVLESTGAGSLVVDSTLNNDGQLEALGAGGVTLNNAYVSGLGTLTIAAGSKVALNNSGFNFMAGGVNIAGPVTAGSTTTPGGLFTTTAGNLAAVGTNGQPAGDYLNSNALIVNGGTIEAVDNSTLNFDGPLMNSSSGELFIDGVSHKTTLVLYGYNLSATGGSIVLSDSRNNSIVSNGQATNFALNSILSGSGVIGDGILGVSVGTTGIINSNGAKGLTLNGHISGASGGYALNQNVGLIETTGAGGLTITGMLTNLGTLSAIGAGALTLKGVQIQSSSGYGAMNVGVAGSLVLRGGANIQQQNLSLAAGGAATTTAADTGSTTDMFSGNLTNAGILTIVGNSTLGLQQNLINSGQVVVKGASLKATLQIDSNLSIMGGGAILLQGANASIVSGSSVSYFTNEGDTISGIGSIGDASMNFSNQQGATIDATGAAGQSLTLACGSNSINNSGVIESTGAGALIIKDQINNTGQLEALGSGAVNLISATVQGPGSITIASGGTLVLNNSGLSYPANVTIGSAATPGGMLTTASGNLTAVGTTNSNVGDFLTNAITNNGTVDIVDNSTLNLDALISNGPSGQVLLGSTGHATRLAVYAYNDIEGGSVVLSDFLSNAIVSNGSGEVLSLDTNLSGSGVIGDGYLALQNGIAGIINSNGARGLTIKGDDLAAAQKFFGVNSNSGLIETTGAGGLTITGAFNNFGTLSAAGRGALKLSSVQLQTNGLSSAINVGASASLILSGGTSIMGGDINVAAGGKLATTAGDTGSTADSENAIFTNAGALTITAGSTLNVSYDLINSGQIVVNGNTTTTRLQVPNNLTLDGGGTLQLTGAHASLVSAQTTTMNFFQNVSDKITGAGVLGDAYMSITNGANGVISSSGSSGMTINANTLTNSGLIESGSAAGLTISGPSSIYNQGVIEAVNGGNVDVAGSLNGQGIVRIAGSGLFEIGGAANNAMVFSSGAAGELILDQSAQTGGQISGFAAGDTIDLRDFAYSAGNMSLGPQSNFGPYDGNFQISNGSTNSDVFWLEGNYTSAYLSANHLAFQFSDDSHAFGMTGSDGTLVKLVSTG